MTVAIFDQFEHATLSDVGVRRSHNQDALSVLLAADDEQWKIRGHVYVVADGMGAHAVGELASEMSKDIIPHTYHKYAGDGPSQALRKAFIEANSSIYSRGQQNREFKGMGTTTTALVVRPEGAWVGHVGDSRAYRIREGQIEQLSFDHSLVWEMARRHKVNPDGVQGVPSNIIIRSLGPEANVQVDVEGPHPLHEGDIFLLCSDGLSGPVSDNEIGAVASVLPPAEACRFLVDLANLRGGPDNITVIVVRVGNVPSAEENATDLAKKKAPWFRRLPWPLGALTLGVLMAGGAVAMSLSNTAGGGFVFALAAVVLLIGLAGLGMQYVWEKNKPEESTEKRRLKIYRSYSCRIDQALFDNLSKAETSLVQIAHEKKWDADWDTVEEHQQSAKESLSRNDLESAFREMCRAIMPLSQALQKHRHKEEVFQPNFGKTQDAKGDAGGK